MKLLMQHTKRGVLVYFSSYLRYNNFSMDKIILFLFEAFKRSHCIVLMFHSCCPKHMNWICQALLKIFKSEYAKVLLLNNIYLFLNFQDFIIFDLINWNKLYTSSMYFSLLYLQKYTVFHNATSPISVDLFPFLISYFSSEYGFDILNVDLLCCFFNTTMKLILCIF